MPGSKQRRSFCGQATLTSSHLIAVVGIALLFLTPAVTSAGIVSGAGTGDITFNSTFFPDGVIGPSHTTGPSIFPQYGGLLTHEAFAPGGAEHAYMGMSWDFSASDAEAFILGGNTPFDTTKLELVPSPPVSAHHAATMTGSFEILYTLDAAGLPGTLLPARSYQVFSYVSPLPGSPAAASFDMQLDYTDVGFGLLGSQIIHYDAPPGLGVLATVSSLPLFISIPAGHTTLKLSGFFKLSADSDDFMGGPPPFDTLIGVIPEPGSLSLLACGVGLLLALRRRRLGHF